MSKAFVLRKVRPRNKEWVSGKGLQLLVLQVTKVLKSPERREFVVCVTKRKGSHPSVSIVIVMHGMHRLQMRNAGKIG
jgi:hypothetical protein